MIRLHAHALLALGASRALGASLLLGASLALGASVGGCAQGAADACSSPAAAPRLAAGLGVRAFVIRDGQLVERRMVGFEGFSVEVTVDRPAGRYIKAYGVRSPYEEYTRELQADVAQPSAATPVSVRCWPLTVLPATGSYPFDFWLINERGEVSNAVSIELPAS